MGFLGADTHLWIISKEPSMWMRVPKDLAVRKRALRLTNSWWFHFLVWEGNEEQNEKEVLIVVMGRPGESRTKERHIFKKEGIMALPRQCVLDLYPYSFPISLSRWQSITLLLWRSLLYRYLCKKSWSVTLKYIHMESKPNSTILAAVCATVSPTTCCMW